jgi:hypothetical protein
LPKPDKRAALERARFLTAKTTHFFNGSSATLGLAFARDSDLVFSVCHVMKNIFETLQKYRINILLNQQ